MATTLNMLSSGVTNVDRFVKDAPPEANYGLECIPPTGPAFKKTPLVSCYAGHWYDYFPIGTSVIVLPLFAAMQAALPLVGPHVPHWGPFLRDSSVAFFAGDLLAGRSLTESLCAATFGAVTVWFQYQIALLFLSRRGATWYALLFAFGTAELSIASRNLSPHGLTLLLLSASLYLLLRPLAEGRDSTASYGWAGFLLSAAFAVRPSNAVACGVFAVYVALHHRRHLLRFCLCATPVCLMYFGYQLIDRDSLIPLYLTEYKLGNSFVDGLGIHLFSPSRGLFIFTPIFLFSLWGMVLAVKQRWLWGMAPYLIGMVGLHSAIVIKIWPGYCYGARYFADITHLMLLFLIPVFKAWQGFVPQRRSAFAAVFLLLAFWGVFVHVRGATSREANDWSALPLSVDTNQWRVWQWSDAQFMRGLGGERSLKNVAASASVSGGPFSDHPKLAR